MSVFASFLILLLILVEAAPPTASSVPTLGNNSVFIFNTVKNDLRMISSASKVTVLTLFIELFEYYDVINIYGDDFN